jgi:heptosyltransferase-2
MLAIGADRILLISPNWVGDTLLMTPALAGLRRHYPKARITAVVTPWTEPLLAHNTAVDELIVYDPKGKQRSWVDRLRFASELRRIGFDTAILFPNSFHAALIAYLARIPKRVGYNTDGRGILLTRSVPLDKDSKRKHIVEYYLDIIRALGVEVTARGLCLNLCPADEQFAEQFLISEGIDSAQPLVAIHPGAVKPEKRWSAKRFAEVAKIMIAQYGAYVILLGSSTEQELLQHISRLITFSRVLIPEGTSLTQTAALIKRCQLFIGNDSGLMHVAAALGIPVVAVFGPGTPVTTAPWMDKELYRVVLKEFDCRPCRQRFFTECTASPQGKPPCLEAVTTEQVLTAIDELRKPSASHIR